MLAAQVPECHDGEADAGTKTYDINTSEFEAAVKEERENFMAWALTMSEKFCPTLCHTCKGTSLGLEQRQKLSCQQ